MVVHEKIRNTYFWNKFTFEKIDFELLLNTHELDYVRRITILENKASNETDLFHIFDLFSHVQSARPRLYHQY